MKESPSETDKHIQNLLKFQQIPINLEEVHNNSISSSNIPITHRYQL